MRVLERRLRKLEVGLLPPAVTEASRDLANSTCRRTLWPNGTVSRTWCLPRATMAAS